MAARGKSLLARLDPLRSRFRNVVWRWDPSDPDNFTLLRFFVLNGQQSEEAHLATVAHFTHAKPKVGVDSDVFLARERLELVLRAARVAPDNDAATAAECEPIADSADELAELLTLSQVSDLYTTWRALQSEISVLPASQAEMDELVEALKKNSHEVPLAAFSTSLLIALARTLAERLASSTTGN